MSSESDVIKFSLVDMLTDHGYIVNDAEDGGMRATESASGVVISLRTDLGGTSATWFARGRRYDVGVPTTRDGIAILLASISAEKHRTKSQQCDCEHE
jgi:hypothetical protein